MKKLILVTLLTFIISIGLSFLTLFEGDINQVSVWWGKWSRDSASLPFSPYKERRENSADFELHSANKIILSDERLFWKGDGAKCLPELTKGDDLANIIITDGGSGYSSSVIAEVIGANAKEFTIGKVQVIGGSISKINILKSAKWSKVPLAFIRGEEKPFSGTIESTFPSGQILEETNYLSGKIHGKTIRYDRSGIPVANKDYVHGQKHGTHIFWYPKTVEPSDYKPQLSAEGDVLPSLWTYLQSEAKEKFKTKYGNHESNKWITDNYKLKGGSFQVKLLEHCKDNRKHGLFEGFDEFSNKTFKDEFKNGLRIKHQIFDKQI